MDAGCFVWAVFQLDRWGFVCRVLCSLLCGALFAGFRRGLLRRLCFASRTVQVCAAFLRILEVCVAVHVLLCSNSLSWPSWSRCRVSGVPQIRALW